MKKLAIKYKKVAMREDTQWAELEAFAKELSEEMGINFSLADAALFAVKFTRENRVRQAKNGTD